jgi:hypothetical protein
MSDELDKMRHLWDGPERWVLLRHVYAETAVTVRFAGDRPSLLEIARVRRLIPQFHQTPSGEVKRFLHGRDRLRLGRMPVPQAAEIAARGRQLGLIVEERAVARAVCLPYRPADRMILTIDDDDLSERVVAAMLQAGVPVVDEMPGEADVIRANERSRYAALLRAIRSTEESDMAERTPSWPEPPRELEGADVLYYAVLREFARPKAAAICLPPEGGVSLFYCDDRWQVTGDTHHASVAEAVSALARKHPGAKAKLRRTDGGAGFDGNTL